jgi:hypothetical protein
MKAYEAAELAKCTESKDKFVMQFIDGVYDYIRIAANRGEFNIDIPFTESESVYSSDIIQILNNNGYKVVFLPLSNSLSISWAR